MPQVPAVPPPTSPRLIDTAPRPTSPPAAMASSPRPEAASVPMPALPEGMPAHERAAALMAALADPRSWLKD